MIQTAINKLSSLVIKKDVSWADNVHQPKIRISKTVKPDREYSFNEISENLYKQIRK